jgi:2-oxoglutarate dehydrogenase E2 component (dihydrolipoamide succinyltransferase)
MPAAARVLAEAGLPASAATPTGPGGRLLKEDALRAAAPAPSPAPAPAPSVPSARPETAEHPEEVVRMSRLRRTVASRLVQAKSEMALLTTFNEVDMSAVMSLRKEIQESFTARHGVKVGFMSFFVKAVVDALKLVPQLNAEIRGDDIVYKHYFDIGVAIGGGKGLVVPVLRNAERLSFAGIEKSIVEFATRAKEGKLMPAELEGGSFTISNGGVYGSLLSTPIVNPPQSGVLGMHTIQERPIALNGQVVIRPMMYIALTYDHRIVDGKEAVTFLKRVKEVIENPSRLLLEA